MIKSGRAGPSEVLALNIEPHCHVAIYLQVADQVHVAVAAGVYRIGEPLPVRRTRALSLGVNPNTVQKAFVLERRELVVPRRRFAVSANPASPVGAA